MQLFNRVALWRYLSPSRSKQYLPLQSDVTLDDDCHEDGESLNTDSLASDEQCNKGSTPPSNRCLPWACAAALFSTAISIVVFTSNIHPDPASPPSAGSLNSPLTPRLRRPTAYTNIEKALPHESYTFPPVVNFPQTVLQVRSSADGPRTMREDDRVRPSRYGSVYPDDRHIFISPEISTVAQFRILDYGMETCVLSASAPRASGKFDPAAKLQNGSYIEVWVLREEEELKPRIGGFWNVAASRRDILTNLTLSPSGTSSSFAFHCQSDTFVTVELACSNTAPDCFVDFWQDRRATPIGGIHITQFQTTHL